MIFKKNKNTLKSGLTLIELLTSIFIIGLISSVVVFNHREFNDHLKITNLAYSIALSIREAQVSGISVKGDATSGDFTFPYGVFFNITQSVNPNNKAFVIFRDRNENGYYDGNFNCLSGSECLQKIDIGDGNFISYLCSIDNVGTLCIPQDINGGLGIDITFKRPKPDAIFYFLLNDGNSYDGSSKSGVIICLESPQGRKRDIKILKTGEISVEKGEVCHYP